MPLIDRHGLPILGTKSPQEQMHELVQTLRDEKANLEADDHDWQVIVAYALTFDEAERAGKAFITGIEADPPVALGPHAMINPIGPICHRCEQHWALVNDLPCPGVNFGEYVASLPEEERAAVLRALDEKMQSQGAGG